MKRELTKGRVPMLNLRSHPVRTLILLMLVIFQVSSAYTGMMTALSMGNEMNVAQLRLGADILIYPSEAMSRISAKKVLMQGSPVPVWKSRDSLSRLQDLRGIRNMAFQVYICDTASPEETWIVGFDPAVDFVICPWAGEETVRKLPVGSVLAGCGVEQKNLEVTLFGKSWPVAGCLEETGSDLDRMVFAGPETMEEMIKASVESGIGDYRDIDPHRDYSVVLLRINDRSQLDSITSWLNKYLKKTKAIRTDAALEDASFGIRGRIGMVIAVTVGIWGMFLLILALAQGMMMKERRKELYIWQVIGASKGLIISVMTKEALLIHAAGGAAGILLGVFLSSRIKGTHFSLPWALAIFCLSVFVGTAAAALSVKRNTDPVKGQMLLTV